MVTFLSILLFIVCILLILLVLIQDSKGGGMGVMGGGSGGSSTLWGATGAASFLEKLTRVVAIVFFVMSFILAWEAGKKSESVVDSMPLPAAAATDGLAPQSQDSDVAPEAANGPGTEAPATEKQEN